MENNHSGEDTSNSPLQSNPSDNLSFYDRELTISPIAVEYLRETAKWAKFMAIIGLVGMGLYVLIIIFFLLFYLGTSSQGYFNSFNGVSLAPALIAVIFYIVLCVIPTLWLYKFGNNLTNAINNRNSEVLTTSFKFLKQYYKFIGIMIIVMLGLYILIFLGAIATGFLATLAN